MKGYVAIVLFCTDMSQQISTQLVYGVVWLSFKGEEKSLNASL